MQTRNIGQKPNDAVHHAEATVLMRIARANGSNLKGRDLTIYVERDTCNSCLIALPLLGLEMGNPRVTFVDLQTGNRISMKDGRWE
jgi:tRNA(Arg) A34 adenosine deaminase TadA